MGVGGGGGGETYSMQQYQFYLRTSFSPEIMEMPDSGLDRQVPFSND